MQLFYCSVRGLKEFYPSFTLTSVLLSASLVSDVESPRFLQQRICDQIFSPSLCKQWQNPKYKICFLGKVCSRCIMIDCFLAFLSGFGLDAFSKFLELPFDHIV